MRKLTGIICAMVATVAAADELDVARQALRDGLWNVARTHAAPIAGDEARLVVLESLAGEGKWDEIKATLAGWTDAKGDGFDYYRAIVAGDHAAAMAVLKRNGSKEGYVEARMHEADELRGKGDRAGAEAIWREVAGVTNVGERVLATASMNLMDADLLRRAYAEVKSGTLRRMVGLRLGTALLRTEATAADGERLIRTIVKDAPDAQGAKEALLAVADMKVTGGLWKAAHETYRAAIEIWPEAAKVATVQEGLGWALQKLGRKEEALEAFRQAGELATDEMSKATALLKEGDVLSDLGRAEEAMAKYREVIAKYPKTTIADKLKVVVRIRELEAEGRKLYKEFRFGEAMKRFGEVSAMDPARGPRMKFYSVLCLYGQGLDDEAAKKARALVADCADPAVRFDAMLWLAKFLYNRREWKESGKLFMASAALMTSEESAAEAQLWAARSALADNDFKLAIQLTTELLEKRQEGQARIGALIVQGEALIELARFDEAVLVFERIAVTEGARAAEKARAQRLRADALYAMGTDNPSRYEAALEAYRGIRFDGEPTASDRLVVAFKIARSLEKLKRTDEAIDQYYAEVVIAYREGRKRGERYDDEARAAFSRAAFSLADEYESRGKDMQAANVLGLVVDSDVPAAGEARKRIERISSSGRFL